MALDSVGGCNGNHCFASSSLKKSFTTAVDEMLETSLVRINNGLMIVFQTSLAAFCMMNNIFKIVVHQCNIVSNSPNRDHRWEITRYVFEI